MCNFSSSIAILSPPLVNLDLRLGVTDEFDEVSMHPAIEIVDTRFKTFGALDPLSHRADQGNHGALIVGPALSDWRSLDPVRQPVTLIINGKHVCDTIGGNSAVDPVRLLVWLANVGSRSLGGLHAGQFVTTGSCTGTIFVNSAAQVAIDFQRLGAMTLAID
jgi:2-keto-4-pentenoate hydratase